MKNIIFLLICIATSSLIATEKLNKQNDNSSKKEEISVSKSFDVKLTSLIFTANTNKLLDAENVYQGIVIDKLFVPNKEKFVKKMSLFLQKPINKGLLEKIKEETLVFYKENDFPFVSVLIPSGQDITLGNVKVLIIIPKIGDIKIEGTKYFSSKRILDQLSLKRGDSLDYKKMIKDISWINESPFLNTYFLLEEGKNFGETNLILKVKEKFPLRVYGGYENTGNIIAGNNRLLTGFNLGNVFGKDQLNYQFMCSSDIDKWQGHTASYIIPLKWRHIFKIFGSYVKIFDSQADYISKGKSKQLSGRYTIPIYTHKIKHNVIIGYDFKRTNNFLNFALALDFNNNVDISQFIIGYELLYNYLAFRNMNYISPGHMTKFDKDVYYIAMREGADCRYVYSTFSLDYSYYFPLNFSYILSSSAQISSAKLMPSEEFILGGYYTVRGYKENDNISDFGFLLKNEIRTPPVNLFNMKQHDIQFLTFWDFGTGFDSDKSIMFKNVNVLTSVGGGFRYHIKDYLNARFDVGFPLTKIKRKDFIKSRYNCHTGVYLAF